MIASQTEPALDTTSQKILAAARELFARYGYDGVSVRDICNAAGCNANAVHYHFESKPKLFATILRQFGDEMLASARRALALTSGPTDAAEFRTRLQIFLEELLVSLLARRELVVIVHMESLKAAPPDAGNLQPESLESLREFPRFLADYFARARDAGLLKASVDPEIVAQLVMKPALTMVLNCPGGEGGGRNSIEDPEYRAHWCRQMLGILLDGALASDAQT